MSAPVHKTCYRCGAGLAELVQPADLVGGLHGQCSDCRLRLAAEDLARKWHARHPEAAGKPEAGNLKPEGSEIPRGMTAPHCCACGAQMYADGDLWQCPAEECRNFEPISPEGVLPTEHTKHTEGKTNL